MADSSKWDQNDEGEEEEEEELDETVNCRCASNLLLALADHSKGLQKC